MLTGSRWRNCATVRLWGAVGLLSCEGMTLSLIELWPRAQIETHEQLL